MSRTNFFLAACSTFAVLFCATFAHAADPSTTLIEAEKNLTAHGKAFQDPRASGQACAVLFLGDGTGAEFVKRRAVVPAGDYLVTACIEIQPLSLLHNFSLHFRAGQAARNFGTIQFDPTPGIGYQPISFRIVHPGGPLDLSLSASGKIGFDGVRHDNTEEEKVAAKAGAAASGTIKLSDDKRRNDALGDMDLNENPPLAKLAFTDNRVVCDRIELTALRTPSAVVTTVVVDKIHYLPNETVKATATVNGLSAGGAYQFVAEIVTESDNTREVFKRDIPLTAGKAEPIAFEFPLDGKTEFGHELRCSLKQDGKTVHDHAALFGVSKNVYRVGITGEHGGADKAYLTLDTCESVMQRNKDLFANYFECFSWAPSDYSDLTPDTEFFWSGQTQYPGSITGFKNMFAAARKRGIKGMAYVVSVSGGIEGYNSYRKNPSFYVPEDSFSTLMSFFLERSWHREFAGPGPGPDKKLQISWQSYNDLWGSATPDGLAMAADEIVRSAEQLGWDGVRWDAHWTNHVAEVKEPVNKRRPGFVWGYNISFANPGSSIFLPGERDDFHECAKDHGMMMDESVRDWSNTNFSPGTTRPFYDALCREADYIKRINGYPLIITFDMGSRLDVTCNVLWALAAGQRYTYMVSPGDFAYGSTARFLTRYSAFVWDDTARIVDAGKLVGVTVGKGPKGVTPWWDQSTWLRKLPDGKQQLLVNLVNPPGYGAFCNRVQPPPATLENVTVTAPIPAGAKLVRALHVSPDLVEGQEAIKFSAEGQQATAIVPKLRAWSIVVFEYAATAGGELAYPAFKLTTPVEDADAVLKQQDEAKRKAEAEKQVKAMMTRGNKTDTQPADAQVAPVAPPAPAKPFYEQFDKTFNADESAIKNVKRPVDMNMRRNGVLDVHHAKGPFSWLNPIELAIGLNGGGAYSSSYIYRETFKDRSDGYMSDFPDSFVAMLKNDIIVIDNVHAMDLGPRRRGMITEYVRNGGSLLYFGGLRTISGGYHHNSALEEVLPVKVTKKDTFTIDEKGMLLEPAKKGFFAEDLDWKAQPMACYVEASALREGTEVLATVGGKPAIVASTLGKGRVITFLMNPHGDFPKGSLPYWEWSGYPQLLAACVHWLADGADKTYVAKPDPVVINPNEVLPSNLAIEGSMLESAEFTKRLRSAQKNLVDAETARTLLETALGEVDKIEDQELLAQIANAAGEYVDLSFAPLARKLVASQHVPLRRVGFQVLGLAGDKSLRGALENGLTESDVKSIRAILIALARIGEKESIPAVKRYVVNGGSERLLAMSVLRRLGYADALKEGLPLYDAGRFNEIAIKTNRLSLFNDLYGGVSFKLTPLARKLGTLKYELTVEKEAQINFDNRYFVESLTTFADADVETMTDYLSKADSYRVAPLAYSVLPRLAAPLAEKFRAGLVKATLPELQMLSKK